MRVRRRYNPAASDFRSNDDMEVYRYLGAKNSRGDMVILIVLSAWMAAVPAFAQNDTADLDRAIQLYDGGDYHSAGIAAEGRPSTRAHSA